MDLYSSTTMYQQLRKIKVGKTLARLIMWERGVRANAISRDTRCFSCQGLSISPDWDLAELEVLNLHFSMVCTTKENKVVSWWLQPEVVVKLWKAWRCVMDPVENLSLEGSHQARVEQGVGCAEEDDDTSCCFPPNPSHTLLLWITSVSAWVGSSQLQWDFSLAPSEIHFYAICSLKTGEGNLQISSLKILPKCFFPSRLPKPKYPGACPSLCRKC